jgi:DNA polymerase III psi subunit
MSQTDYLNAMGISTWVLQDAEEPTETPVVNASAENTSAAEPSSVAITQSIAPTSTNAAPKVTPNVTPKAAPVEPLAMDPAYAQAWTFVMDQLNGDASLLFDKILASLMLSRDQIQILTSSEVLAGKATGQVIMAMGADMGKKLLQMTEPFEELRATVHSLEAAEMEWPIVLTYHPEHLLKRPLDKSKTWQDLILARSLI